MVLKGATRVQEYYSVQDNIVGTITSAATTTVYSTITGTNVSKAYDVLIMNDGTGTITVVFNTTTNAGLPLAPDEKYSDDMTEVTKLLLNNVSGATTSYRVVLKGV